MYPTTEERVFSGFGADVSPTTRARARSVCASSRAKFAWMRLDVCAARKGGTIYGSLRESADAVVVLRDLHARNELLLRESVSVLLLNVKNVPMAWALVAVGGLSSVAVEIAQIFRPAVLLPAASVILCHNHPGGTVEPSADDYELTRKSVDAGRILGVRVLDHIILTEDDYYSFQEKGVLPA